MSTNEIFLDPDFSRNNPEEALFRIAFNEAGRLGLITSYHRVVKDIIFVGISLSTSESWVAKMPLAIKEEVNPHGLTSAASVLEAMFQRQIKTPKFLSNLLSQLMQNPSKGSFIAGFPAPDLNNPDFNPTNTFGSPLPPEENYNPFNKSNNNIKFSFDDFLKEFDIDSDSPPIDDNGE